MNDFARHYKTEAQSGTQLENGLLVLKMKFESLQGVLGGKEKTHEEL